MTSTDRAFIAALQQASATPAPAAPIPEITSPHFAAPTPAASRRAPLSEHLARRRQSAAEPFRPGVETPAFAWPPVAETLAQEARGQLQDVLDAVSRGEVDAPAPAVQFLGARSAVGATTTLLATARLVARMGGRVAIIDQDGGAAPQLGVRRSATAGPLAGAAIDDAVVASRADSVSVLALPANADPAPAIERLAAEHDLVLIDAAEPVASAGHALLIDTAAGDSAARAAALRALISAGVTPTGVIETLG